MVDDSIEKVRAFLARPRCRKSDLAEAAGIWPSKLSKIESPAWNPTVKTLRALCAAVDRLTPPEAP